MNLGIYLRDHLAGAEAGCQLLARLARHYPAGDVGRSLRDLLAEIRADKRVLHELTTSVGAKPPVLKRAGGWIAEKAGRLKLSFRTGKDSSLSLFEGLELLSIGVLGKRAMWTALHRIQDSSAALQRVDFTGLEIRAIAQYERLEAYRLMAASAALVNHPRHSTLRAGSPGDVAASEGAIRESQPLRLGRRETRATRKVSVNGERPVRPKARSH